MLESHTISDPAPAKNTRQPRSNLFAALAREGVFHCDSIADETFDKRVSRCNQFARDAWVAGRMARIDHYF